MRAFFIVLALAFTAPVAAAEPAKNAITMSSAEFKRSRGVEGPIFVKPKIEAPRTSKTVCVSEPVYASHPPRTKTVCKTR